jgi:hypothetical protein
MHCCFRRLYFGTVRVLLVVAVMEDRFNVCPLAAANTALMVI